jgi:hypothetical protein
MWGSNTPIHGSVTRIKRAYSKFEARAYSLLFPSTWYFLCQVSLNWEPETSLLVFKRKACWKEDPLYPANVGTYWQNKLAELSWGVTPYTLEMIFCSINRGEFKIRKSFVIGLIWIRNRVVVDLVQCAQLSIRVCCLLLIFGTTFHCNLSNLLALEWAPYFQECLTEILSPWVLYWWSGK